MLPPPSASTTRRRAQVRGRSQASALAHDMRILPWIIGIFVLAIIAAVLLVVIKRPSPTASAPVTNSVSLPTAGQANIPTGGGFASSVNTYALTLHDGPQLAVNDFLHMGATIPDPVNPGIYILAGSAGYCLPNGSCPHGASTTDYSITYGEKTHSFTITLLKEPIGAARAEAEQFLQQTLGVFGATLCGADYYVGAPNYVNALYSGKNLGFSFCKDATPLP